MSLREFFCVFCWPPWPSRIVSKLAFVPPRPSYDLVNDTGCRAEVVLTEDAEWSYSDRRKELLEGFYAKTSRGNRIACMYIRCTRNPRFTILYSHGNATDIGQNASFYLGLGALINCNILTYDYSGYGRSSGKPTEKNMYADAESAWDSLRDRYHLSGEDIILYGQSIGSVATVDLASRHRVAGVVLHSPLMSGMRVAFPNTKRSWWFDAFPNIDKVPYIGSKVLVIHGTNDEVISFSHGLSLFEKCPKTVEPLWVDGAGHNDVELFPQYIDRLKRFVNQELTPTINR